MFKRNSVHDNQRPYKFRGKNVTTKEYATRWFLMWIGLSIALAMSALLIWGAL